MHGRRWLRMRRCNAAKVAKFFAAVWHMSNTLYIVVFGARWYGGGERCVIGLDGSAHISQPKCKR